MVRERRESKEEGGREEEMGSLLCTGLELVILNAPPGDFVPLYFTCSATRALLLKVNKGYYLTSVVEHDLLYDNYRPLAIDVYLQGVIERRLLQGDKDSAQACLDLGCHSVVCWRSSGEKSGKVNLLFTLVQGGWRPERSFGTWTATCKATGNFSFGMRPYDLIVMAQLKHTVAIRLAPGVHAIKQVTAAVVLAARLGIPEVIKPLCRRIDKDGMKTVLATMVKERDITTVTALAKELPLCDSSTREAYILAAAKNGDVDVIVALVGTDKGKTVSIEKVRQDLFFVATRELQQLGMHKERTRLCLALDVIGHHSTQIETTGGSMDIEELIDAGAWGMIDMMCTSSTMSLVSLSKVVEAPRVPLATQRKCVEVMIRRLQEVGR